MRASHRGLAGTAYGVLAVADTLLAAAPDRWRRARVVTKPLLMPALAAHGGSGAVTVAQVCSWAGDVALMREGRRPFLAGLCSFLAAHVAYVVAFRARSSVPLLASPGRRRALGAGSVAALAMAAAAAREDRAFALPVAAYGATLAAMAASAAAVDRDRGRGRVLAGASLFLLSDSLLGARTFLLRERVPVLDSAVMATYTAAQWCIAEGAAPVRR
ncbi:lysoplasmalogenase family protein [Nocardioides aquiterrae]|uniref:Lysoplasmalogenase n=1 Tax=Nocardioides aquiterrae TaxID=203799 RepID=A0ABP4EUX3_9ACTN